MNSSILVNCVVPSSPADRAGVRFGDEIISVSGSIALGEHIRGAAVEDLLQTHRQTDRRIDRQADRQTDKQIDRLTD